MKIIVTQVAEGIRNYPVLKDWVRCSTTTLIVPISMHVPSSRATPTFYGVMGTNSSFYLWTKIKFATSLPAIRLQIRSERCCSTSFPTTSKSTLQKANRLGTTSINPIAVSHIGVVLVMTILFGITIIRKVRKHGKMCVEIHNNENDR